MIVLKFYLMSFKSLALTNPMRGLFILSLCWRASGSVIHWKDSQNSEEPLHFHCSERIQIQVSKGKATKRQCGETRRKLPAVCSWWRNMDNVSFSQWDVWRHVWSLVNQGHLAKLWCPGYLLRAVTEAWSTHGADHSHSLSSPSGGHPDTAWPQGPPVNHGVSIAHQALGM